MKIYVEKPVWLTGVSLRISSVEYVIFHFERYKRKLNQNSIYKSAVRVNGKIISLRPVNQLSDIVEYQLIFNGITFKRPKT